MRAYANQYLQDAHFEMNTKEIRQMPNAVHVGSAVPNAKCLKPALGRRCRPSNPINGHFNQITIDQGHSPLPSADVFSVFFCLQRPLTVPSRGIFPYFDTNAHPSMLKQSVEAYRCRDDDLHPEAVSGYPVLCPLLASLCAGGDNELQCDISLRLRICSPPLFCGFSRHRSGLSGWIDYRERRRRYWAVDLLINSAVVGDANPH
ncbi:hypothetical protein BJ912DRAFT_993345 [Pholiota molesta]|nr:hypothetical protein BJ912DRAFT_993345 [Pholiota molesta]